jgi:hypothetical protein
MEEKLLKEMITLLNDIREKLSVSLPFAVRGPVGDPGPDISRFSHPQRIIDFIPQHRIIDPAPEFFFKKEALAAIKVKELDLMIIHVNEYLDLIRFERDLLAKEFGIKDKIPR